MGGTRAVTGKDREQETKGKRKQQGEPSALSYQLHRQPEWNGDTLVHMAPVRINPQTDDAPEFIARVEQAVNGILALHAPRELILIKIDNWFGFKWMGFAGKFIGRLPIWTFSTPGVPCKIAIPRLCRTEFNRKGDSKLQTTRIPAPASRFTLNFQAGSRAGAVLPMKSQASYLCGTAENPKGTDVLP